MFGNNKKNSSDTSNQLSGSNILLNGTKIEGTLRSSSDIRIDGNIVGDIYCEARLLIGKNAKIEGDVYTEFVYIEGAIQGNIFAKQLTHLKSSAQINGDIQTEHVVIDEGANINGQIKTQPKQAKAPLTKTKESKNTDGERKKAS